MSKKLKIIIAFVFCVSLIAGIWSCGKNNQNVIPYVRVNVFVYPSNPSFNQLNVPGGWAYVDGGSKGIVIYRRSNDEFVAFDRHCTYQPENNCRVSVNSSQIMVVDSCCGSEFVLTDGSVAKSPAGSPLKAYQTSFNGNELRIFN